jgi:hypothetical protein
MGLLNALFGGGKKQSSDDNDGMWLNGERDSSWRSVAKFSETQPIEISPESCYTNEVGTFCVLRSFNKEKNIVLFMGCLVPADEDDFLLIIVDRHETPSGKVVKQDDWTRNRILSADRIPSIDGAIKAARGGANFNNYSTLPPFVFWLTMKLG